jgi:hypothetical protein
MIFKWDPGKSAISGEAGTAQPFGKSDFPDEPSHIVGGRIVYFYEYR